MTDSTISLAARLAANLFVDAIKLAKPGARLAAKIGDRALSSIGHNPFNEAEAQRFLYEDALNKAEEANEALEPGDLMSIKMPDGTVFTDYTYSKPADIERAHRTIASVCQAIDVLTSAPGCTPKPPVDAERPSVADPPSEATEGHPTSHRLLVDDPAFGLTPETPDSHGEQPASVGVTGPGAGEVAPGRAEHPLYREIQDQCNAALVAEVLSEHRCFWNDDDRIYECLTDGCTHTHTVFKSHNQWIAHVAPLIIAALQQ
ncbi:hypothetical protein MHPYR_180109 [uncultured Mycobacterium sp.]|uniref:Uncharacterized protein n=1 Tax=uncultured Mycobacterium sp. TaxID=171292 RepID=A0A1Y5P5E1_9MYCO|nr:hypothetical protein MHPYR_180109 [uncultured Mycobacterium sp.]